VWKGRRLKYRLLGGNECRQRDLTPRNVASCISVSGQTNMFLVLTVLSVLLSMLRTKPANICLRYLSTSRSRTALGNSQLPSFQPVTSPSLVAGIKLQKIKQKDVTHVKNSSFIRVWPWMHHRSPDVTDGKGRRRRRRKLSPASCRTPSSLSTPCLRMPPMAS